MLMTASCLPVPTGALGVSASLAHVTGEKTEAQTGSRTCWSPDSLQGPHPQASDKGLLTPEPTFFPPDQVLPASSVP